VPSIQMRCMITASRRASAKADMIFCGSPLSRSLFGVKRTSLFAAQMSVSDPSGMLVDLKLLRSLSRRGWSRRWRSGCVLVRRKYLEDE
jgi:hypothetical protein